jgi:protein-S-isoprenylcysteine O-methyltransferase Ste14
MRGREYSIYSSKLLWILETGIYIVLAVLVVLRLKAPPMARAEHPGEILLPLAGGVWPFLLLTSPRTEFGIRYQNEIMVVMVAGTAIALTAYLSLREAFAIIVEARTVKTCGLYRLVRHPVYTGQIITAAAVLVWRFSLENVFVFLGFVAVQWYRTVLEERKLKAAFPFYEEYASRRSRFFPGLW